MEEKESSFVSILKCPLEFHSKRKSELNSSFGDFNLGVVRQTEVGFKLDRFDVINKRRRRRRRRRFIRREKGKVGRNLSEIPSTSTLASSDCYS